MHALDVTALRSGSSGNLFLLEQGAERLLIDCGVNGKQFTSALAEQGIPADELKHIRGILVTHEHRDHIAGLGVVMRRYKIPVYISEATLLAAEPQLGKYDPSLINVIEAGKSFELANFRVTPFSVSHDAADPLGFAFDNGHCKLAYCTDTGILDDEMMAYLRGSKLVFLEANYEPNLLELGSYPWVLKQRIKSAKGHLSNQTAATACRSLLEQGTEYFVLAHLSQDNNYPALARLVALEAICGEDAKQGADFQLYIANRYTCTESVRL